MSTVPQDMPDWTYEFGVAPEQIPIEIKITSDQIPMEVKVSESITLNVIVQSGSVDANLKSVDPSVVITVQVQSGNLDVNIKTVSPDVTFNVTVQSGTIDANLKNVDPTVTINVKVTNTPVDVNIYSQSTTLNVNVQGTASVSIDNATVYLNVKRDISEPAVQTFESFPIDQRDTDLDLGGAGRSFYLHHGARGAIDNIQIYVKNTTGADQTVTVEVGIRQDLPPLFTLTTTVTASETDYVRKTLVFAQLWDYDSIAITVKSASGVYIAGKTAWGHGGYKGGTFQAPDYIPYVKIVWSGKPAGYLPVSGTVNTIQIPNTSAAQEAVDIVVPAKSTKTAIKIEGTGRLKYVFAWMLNPNVFVRILVDDKLIENMNPESLNKLNVIKERTGWRLLHYSASASEYGMDYILELPFRKSLEIRLYNAATSDQTVTVKAVYEVIS